MFVLGGAQAKAGAFNECSDSVSCAMPCRMRLLDETCRTPDRADVGWVKACGDGMQQNVLLCRRGLEERVRVKPIRGV